MPSNYILPVCLLIPAAVQVFYYLFIFSRYTFARQRSVAISGNELPISVIICGRNEQENFKKNLPHFLKQDYANYEVVAVNDQSVDDSLQVLEALQDEYPHLRIVDVKENDRFWRGKKYGLTLGIKGAQHEHMLFTDADCVPKNENWVSEMAAGFKRKDKALVLGLGAYKKQRGLLNIIIRYETLLAAIQYMSWAMWGVVYMGVGRNLGYTKKLFFDNSGFMSHMHIPMGDDDLFVNEAGKRKLSTTIYSKNSITYSEPETKFNKWFEQKRRHVATAKHYKLGHKLNLGFFAATSALFYASIIATALLPNLPLWVWYGFVARFVIQYVVVAFAAKKTSDWDILLLLPFLEIFLLMNQILIFVANMFNKQFKWK